MKRKTIKAIALLTSAVMLAGCGGQAEQEVASAESSAQEEQADEVSADESAQSDGEAQSGGTWVDYTGMSPTEMVEANRAADWKITDEPITLRVMIANTPEHPDDMNEQELIQRAEERTGIHIEWVMPGSSAFNEQKSLALASGDMPDIILNGLTDSEIARYGADGTLMAYNELMEEYPGMAPNLEHIYEERPDIKRFITSPDGNIYSAPRINEGAWMKQNGNAIINVQWLDNLGLEMPTSIDELKEVLRAFKEQDANGNGDPNDEIPLTMAASDVKLQGNSGGFNLLMGSFGVIADNDFRMLQDGKLVCSATTEGWKEGIAWYHELYEEALRWVDYIYDKVNSLEMIEGDFGGRLELQDEGYYIIGEPLEGMDSQYVYRYSVCPGHAGAWCVQEKEYNEVLRLTFTEPRSNFNDEFCAPYYVEPFPPVFFTPEEADEMSTLNSAILDEIARQSCEWMMNGGIEEEWDTYLATLDSIGLQRWLEINEQAAERYNNQ